ncbi:MAG: hypothetical protein ACXVAN_06505 [Polyangia bacterium]
MRIALFSLVLFGCGATLDDSPIEDAADALSTDCATARAVVCHDSPNNCSYAARRCDPVPRALDRASRTSSFALAGSGHAVEDSLGNVIGRTTGGSVHLNWGQRRTLHGTAKVLAFAAATDAGTVSGWINVDAIAHDLSWMPSAEAPDPGGATATWHVVESNDAGYRDATGASLKVVASCGSGMNATDYLARNGRVNLIFNLPGYQNPPLGSGTIDVYPLTAAPRFLRVESQASLARPLFDCATGTPRATSKSLRFLYGSIADAPSRHGWIAEPNVAPGS